MLNLTAPVASGKIPTPGRRVPRQKPDTTEEQP
ncbi:hypothetical protein AVEN_89961-1, partial [Araneus ventricosus]